MSANPSKLGSGPIKSRRGLRRNSTSPDSERAMRRHELSDEEWAVIAPLLPNKPRGVAPVDDRRVVNGILWRFHTGAPWRDAPERYGPRTKPFTTASFAGRSCPLTWWVALAVAVLFAVGLADQDAAAGMLMRGALPSGAMVSSVM